MATFSSILAWKIPWTEGPGGLQYSLLGHMDSGRTEHTHTTLSRKQIFYRS